MKTLQQILDCADTDVDVVLDDLVDTTLRSRRSVCADPEIDHLHREMIVEQSGLRNSMYRRLLDGTMSEAEYFLFMSEYYNASIKSFYLVTLPKSVAVHREPVWQNYLRHIMEQESTPRPHYVLFGEFMDLCGAPRLPARIEAQVYSRGFDAGYTAPSAFSAGYALAAEAEAGYEIALLKKGFCARYSQYFSRVEYFDAHLNGQEDEHAEASTDLLKAVVRSPEDLRAATNGFRQFFADLSTFMEGVSDLLDRGRGGAERHGSASHRAAE
jgi:hypothetical protein